MFRQNEGILDRVARTALATVLIPVGLLVYGLLHANVLGLVIAGFGVWLLITAITGICLLYIPFGFSTLEKEKELIAKCRSMMSSFRSGKSFCRGERCGPYSKPAEESQNQPG